MHDMVPINIIPHYHTSGQMMSVNYQIFSIEVAPIVEKLTTPRYHNVIPYIAV